MIPYIKIFVARWIFFPLLRIKKGVLDKILNRITYDFFNGYHPREEERIEFDNYILLIEPK